MGRLYEGLEQVPFKKLGDVYVFQTPSPWIFARSHRYLVTESQRIEIAGVLRDYFNRIRRPMLAAAFLFPLAMALAGYLLFRMRLLTPLNAGAGALLMYLPLIAAPRIYLAGKLRPVLAGLPRTRERITLGDGMRKFAGKASLKLIAIGCISGVAILAGNAINFIIAVQHGRPIYLISLLAFGTAGALVYLGYFGWLAFLRAKSKRVAP